MAERGLDSKVASTAGAELVRPSAVILTSDDRLRGVLAPALAHAGYDLRDEGEAAAELLVVEAGDGDPLGATLRPEAISAVQAFGARAETGADRSIVFVATLGPAPEALHGAVRAFARRFAPGVRVNAIAPERPGGAMDGAQVCALTVYLARARTVTGQTLVAGPAASS